MTTGMHAGELAVDAGLVRRLLAAQMPQWAGLPLEAVRSAGTDNALFRLGDELLVRLPRIGWAAAQPELEYTWLPQLAPQLPLPVSAPIALGRPGEGYPWHWSVGAWLPGENATRERLGDMRQAARDLAGFLRALQRIDASGASGPPPPAAERGTPLRSRDAMARDAIGQLVALGMADGAATERAWAECLAAPDWDGPPRWVHGDIQSGNLLAQGGRISAVIDFGCMGVGDPACDLLVAWNLLAPPERAIFRAELGVDDATWARGRGWAILFALMALPYYHQTNPALAAIARRALDEALAA